MLHTQATIHLAIDHGGDDEVVAIFCRHIDAAKQELDARPLVDAVTVSNTTITANKEPELVVSPFTYDDILPYPEVLNGGGFELRARV